MIFSVSVYRAISSLYYVEAESKEEAEHMVNKPGHLLAIQDIDCHEFSVESVDPADESDLEYIKNNPEG